MTLTTQSVWQQFGQKLRQFIAARVNKIEDTEDILQTALVKIHQNIYTLNNPSTLPAWVYQLTRNCIADFYRNQLDTEEFNEEVFNEEEFNVEKSNGTACRLEAVDASEDQHSELEKLAVCLTPFIESLERKYQLPMSMVAVTPPPPAGTPDPPPQAFNRKTATLRQPEKYSSEQPRLVFVISSLLSRY